MKKRIVIQGVSNVARSLKLRCDEIFDVLAFVDRNRALSETSFDGVPIYTDLAVLSKLKYDYIFVTVEDFCGVTKEYHERFQVPYPKMISMLHTHQWGKQATFCALANEIYREHVEGAVAELGVDFGDSAAYLNLFFSDRTLYLFDTFSGFDNRDKEFEQEKGTMVESYADYYDVRSAADNIRHKMFYPERCILKAGYFPESLDGLEDTFSLVHIDCDLQKPILSGLEYFYPRMASGGRILVHDYFNSAFPGVRHAVRQFSKQHGAVFVPDLLFSGVIFVKG